MNTLCTFALFFLVLCCPRFCPVLGESFWAHQYQDHAVSESSSGVSAGEYMRLPMNWAKDETLKSGKFILIDGVKLNSRDDYPCPEAAAIAPCVCYFDADSNSDLDCSAVESEEQLANVFQQEFPIKTFGGFNMTENNAIKILDNILNGFLFERVILSPGPFALEAISEYFLLDSRETLTYLEVYNSQLTSGRFPFAILALMENLEFLHIHGSLLNWMPKLLAPKATTLSFTYGMVDAIKSDTFPLHAGPMELLSLYNNSVGFIEPGSFYWADVNSSVSHEPIAMDLSVNQIQALWADSFVFRDAPVTLWLSYNQIATIEPGTFRFGNGFMTLFLSHNRLTFIEPGTLLLPEITDNFRLLLSLSSNQLTTIDEQVIGDLLPFTTELFIGANPLLCGCDIAWLVLDPDHLAKVAPGATCADGTSLHDLDPADYDGVC